MENCLYNHISNEAGSGDTVITEGNYGISYNKSLECIGMYYIEKDNDLIRVKEIGFMQYDYEFEEAFELDRSEFFSQHEEGIFQAAKNYIDLATE